MEKCTICLVEAPLVNSECYLCYYKRMDKIQEEENE